MKQLIFQNTVMDAFYDGNYYSLIRGSESFQRYVDLQKTQLEKVLVACSPSRQFYCLALGTLQKVLILIHF